MYFKFKVTSGYFLTKINFLQICLNHSTEMQQLVHVDLAGRALALMRLTHITVFPTIYYIIYIFLFMNSGTSNTCVTVPSKSIQISEFVHQNPVNRLL